MLADAVAAGLLTAKDAFDRDTQALSVLLAAAGFEPEPPAGGGRPGWSEAQAFPAEVAGLLTALGWREDGGNPIGRHYLDGVHDVLAVLTPQLGNGLGDPGPSSAAARHLARKALHTNE